MYCTTLLQLLCTLLAPFNSRRRVGAPYHSRLHRQRRGISGKTRAVAREHVRAILSMRRWASGRDELFLGARWKAMV